MMRFSSSFAFTLVELLIALSLSLLLLLAVAEMFQRIGGSMQETRSAMSVSSQLNEATMLLRQDLAQIPSSLATKPEHIKKILDGITMADPDDDRDGYLEIIEGPYRLLNPLHDCPVCLGCLFCSDPAPHCSHSGHLAPSSLPCERPCHPYRDKDGKCDRTVGDVDDIIAFTLINEEMPFRGLVSDAGRLRVEERKAAEIVWFVRGNTLYRRQRLLNDLDPGRVTDDRAPFTNTVEALALRENRTLHAFYASGDITRDGSPTNSFPYPLYDFTVTGPPYSHWQYLRVPILEETLHDRWWDNSELLRNASQWKTIPINGTPEPHPDLWEQPHFFPPSLQDSRSGALRDYVSIPRHPRAGEDVVLTNVLSFDIKVWCSITKDFVDLGTPGTDWASSSIDLYGQGGHVWDSWTIQYQSESEPDPPYVTPLEAIRITVRCFDPASGVIRQVTVTHRFAD